MYKNTWISQMSTQHNHKRTQPDSTCLNTDRSQITVSGTAVDVMNDLIKYTVNLYFLYLNKFNSNSWDGCPWFNTVYVSDLVCVHNFRYKTHDFSQTTNTLYCCIKRNPYQFISQQQHCNIKQTLISPLTVRCLCTAVGKLRLVTPRVLINTDWLSLWGLDNWITGYIPWQYKHSLPN